MSQMDLEVLRRRGAQRLSRRSRRTGALAAFIGIGFEPLISGKDDAAQFWVGLGTAAVVCALVYALLGVAQRRGWSLIPQRRAPAILGLPRAQRREVRRAVRRGAPGDDPDLWIVEQDLVRTIPRNATQTIMFVICAAALIAVLFAHTSRAGWVFLGLLGALAIWQLAWVIAIRRGARAYLASKS